MRERVGGRGDRGKRERKREGGDRERERERQIQGGEGGIGEVGKGCRKGGGGRWECDWVWERKGESKAAASRVRNGRRGAGVRLEEVEGARRRLWG